MSTHTTDVQYTRWAMTSLIRLSADSKRRELQWYLHRKRHRRKRDCQPLTITRHFMCKGTTTNLWLHIPANVIGKSETLKTFSNLDQIK